MTELMSRPCTVLAAAVLAGVAALTAGCNNNPDTTVATVDRPTPATSEQVCSTFVEHANRGMNEAGNALFDQTRAEARGDKAAARVAEERGRAAWKSMIAPIREQSALASDPTLRANLNTFADAIARVSREPGNLRDAFESLKKSDPALYAESDAASDWLEMTCGPITGEPSTLR